jgi:hypothetical protein
MLVNPWSACCERKLGEKFLPLHLLFHISELYQEEWWQQLKHHNKQSYKERLLKNVTPWYILTPQVTELIFLISEMLHQPPEVRYLTIEIFDRWCSCNNQSVRTWVSLHCRTLTTEYPSFTSVILGITSYTCFQLKYCAHFLSPIQHTCPFWVTRISHFVNS